MTNYTKTQVVGETWRRTPQIIFKNNYGSNPIAMFDEEDIITLSSGEYMTNLLSNKLVEVFTPENANTSFPLIDPFSENYTGQTSTYFDLYVSVYSVYQYLAKIRDRGPSPYPSWIWSEETQSWIAPTPSPYPSWIWSEETQSWVAPTPKPDEINEYIWSEETQSWILA